MKIRFLLLLVISFIIQPTCAQSVIKIPFQQPRPFKVNPATVFTTFVSGSAIVLGEQVEISGGMGDYSFEWSYNDKPMGADKILQVSEAGVYVLTVKDGEDCWSTVTFTVEATAGIGDAGDEALVVFPAPATDRVSVKAPFMQEIKCISIVNTDGRVLLKEEVPLVEGDTLHLPILSLLPGYYLIVMQFADKQLTRPLLIN